MSFRLARAFSDNAGKPNRNANEACRHFTNELTQGLFPFLENFSLKRLPEIHSVEI